MDTLLILLAGVLLGSAISNIIRFESTTFGILKIDHKHQLCQVQLDEHDCTKINKKKVVLQVDHNADLSHK